jgi:cerevisin
MRFITFSALISLSSSRSINLEETESASIPDKYIVKLKGGATSSAVDDLRASLQATASHEFSMPGFRGFASTLTAEEVIRLQHSSQVHHQVSTLPLR